MRRKYVTLAMVLVGVAIILVFALAPHETWRPAPPPAVQAPYYAAQAEPPSRGALAIDEKALGPDHPDVGRSLDFLGVVSMKQGRYAEAEPLFKRALGIMEKTVPNHPNLATSLNSLAGLYIKMGRDDEAKKLHERAKRIRAKQ